MREEVERWEGKQDKLLGPYNLEGPGKNLWQSWFSLVLLTKGPQ